MKILQINNCDLPGRFFNGHDLQLSLNAAGIEANQMVMEKMGDEHTTRQICSLNELYANNQLRNLEKRLGMTNLLEPFSEKIIGSRYFQEADIVHYHLIHNNILSLLDIKRIFALKQSVLTVHDPWIVGGHCIHPLECEKWKTGCHDCEHLEWPFEMDCDKSKEIWEIKKACFNDVEWDIVVASDWMKSYIQSSPITCHFKRIHKIPFGLNIDKYKKVSKEMAREALGIPEEEQVIAFRAEEHIVKGLNYIVEALKLLDRTENITILTVGTAILPEWIKKRYRVMEKGWQDEEGVRLCLAAADIFVMTSLGESFGLMTIEAMASKCAVIVFKGTVLEQVSYAPKCGIAVESKNSKAIKNEIERLLKHKEELQFRGELGREIVEKHYKYSDYLKKHIELYTDLADRNQNVEKKYWFDYRIEQERNKLQAMEKMEHIRQFKRKLEALSDFKAKKVCIFCAGIYGTRAYYELKERLVEIAYIVDNNPQKWGTWLDGLECIGMDKLKLEKDNVLVIVCNKNSGLITEELKTQNFPYVISNKELDEMLQDVPRICDIRNMDLIEQLDYSSEGVKALITCFNRTIFDICQYYESKLQ